MRNAGFILSFLLVFLISSNANSQDLFYSGVMHALNRDQEAQLEDAIKILQKASGNENNANAIEGKYAKLEKKSNKKDWNKKTWEAKQQRILAEENYQIAYRKILNVYSDIIMHSIYATNDDKSEALSLNEAALSEFKDAEAKLNKFKNISKEELKINSYDEMKNDLFEIHYLQVNGIRSQISTMQKFMNKNMVVQNTEDELALEKSEKNTTIASNNDDLNDNIRDENVNKVNNKIYTQNDRDANINRGLVFKVQIAASKVDLSDWFIKAKAPDAKNIEVLYLGDWNKYMVGEFDSYQEASKHRDLLRETAPDSFIVVFKSGTQIPVTDAMK